ncbi:MAG: hypothetical protein K0S37_212 [Microbacterium sp.]|jgi:hypothetical protein|nr:hypothetical protein [Microbacterium sp.]
MAEKKTGVDRRTILKGAAWSAPVVALAVASPIAAASGPTCPPELKAGVLGGITTQAVVVGNKGALAFVGALGLDASGVDLSLFQPAYTTIVTSATLTMSDGTTHTGTGLSAGAGTLGQIGALPGTLLFNNITFPSGTYVLNSNPVRPVSLTVTAEVILIGLPTLLEIRCPVTLSWTFSVWGVGVVTSSFLGGAGTINYTGTATAA